MGLFENVGRKVEEFKQQAEEAAQQGASYVCEDCGELLYADQDECPNCGSERVVERDADTENS